MKSVYSISLKKYGTYINLKIRDMGYPKKNWYIPFLKNIGIWDIPKKKRYMEFS